MKKAAAFLGVFLCFSCGDVLDRAGNLGEHPLYDYPVLDFYAYRGMDNREVILRWRNPGDSDFAGVRLLRKKNAAPAAFDDGSADLLYNGTNERYTDSGLSPNATYYYGIYAKNGLDHYSECNYASETVTETAVDIRKRSFFLIGGSSSKTDPTGNLVAGIDMFDPITETITANVATLPVPRVFCDVASVGNSIYVFGGFNGGGVVGTVDILDITDLSWTTGTDMSPAKCALRCVEWNDKIYCLGGSTSTAAGSGTDTVSVYDPSNPSPWTADNDVFAPLVSSRSAFNAVAYSGSIYYYGGVTTGGGWINGGGNHNIIANTELALGGLFYYIGCTGALYTKELDSGDNITIFFTIGGSGTNNQTAFPAAALNLGTNNVYAAFLPNVTGGTPGGNRVYPQAGPNTGIEDFTNRMYAGCEYYGDYLYYFGGITADSQACSIIERLDVKNGILTASEWDTLTVSLSTSRYGFGITKAGGEEE
ncbi:MAG: hypothetical protein JW881_10255 [Spirochaetales bacterium]|nr:hypothetical protein [Spirochaetales bacterium]